jgi:hypothetical protein
MKKALRDLNNSQYNGFWGIHDVEAFQMLRTMTSFTLNIRIMSYEDYIIVSFLAGRLLVTKLVVRTCHREET